MKSNASLHTWLKAALMLLCVLMFTTASAETTVTYGPRAYEPGMRLTVTPRNTTAEDSVTAITAAYFTCDQPLLSVGRDVTWTLYIEGQSANAYTCDYYLWRQSLTETSNMYDFVTMTFNGGTSFTAKPDASGRYFVSVTVKDQYGGELEVQSAIYIAEDETSLADKVAEIVALCKAEGCTSDYDIALFMHDYLIYNACYDQSFTYYFPEGVLLYGTGVCQSYALAYQILMEEMGVECLYVTGVAGDVDHAWNIVDIDGAWYQVDCTWDDPIMVDETGAVVPGGERHDYFCISDDVMAEDHTWDRALYPECGEYGIPATLTITQQPVSVSVSRRETAVVTVIAKGDGLTYEWYFKNADASSFTKTTAFTGNTYSVEMDETRDGRQLYCVITDAYGNMVISDTVTISMRDIVYPESEHPTPTYSVQEWTYTHPEEAYALKITFDRYTCIGIDSLLYLTMDDGTVLKLCDALSGERDPLTEERFIYIVGDSFALQLVTGGYTGWGFTITAVDAMTQAEYETISTPRFTIDSSGVITEYSGCASKLDIPAVIDGIQVTGIGDDLFGNDAYLTSVSFPDSVTHIGFAAFLCCAGLTDIEFPAELKTIDDFAFKSCIGFTSIDVPYGVTSIGEYAFERCINVTSVNIPDSVISIGNGAFGECESLSTIEIPDSVTQLGGAFGYCYSLINVKLPKYITEISEGMFNHCQALESVELPEGITKIGSGAFYNCPSLTNIDIPYGVTSIDASAFYLCIYLKEITITDSVQSIGKYAFYNCNSLTSIHIPDGVTRIENNTFFQCWSLTEIELPESVTVIGDQAFYNLWLLAKINIPDGVTSIGAQAFGACSIYTSTMDVILPPSVTSIGDNAFMPSNIALTVSNNSYAHNWCIENNLVCNVICSTHTWAYDPAASDSQLTCAVCGHMKTVSFCIPADLTCIEAEAFAGLPIQAVIVPEGCESIGSRAFADCTKLLYVYIPADTAVADDAFDGCGSVQIDIAQ